MTISVDIKGDVALITMDDGKVNAVNHVLIDLMHQALDTAEKDAKAIVITGRPERFSAGFDLTIMQQGPDKAMELVNSGGRLMLRLYKHPQPIVAACNGHALAAGTILLLASDTRIGTAGDYKIGLNETAIGMALPVFGLELARARLDPRCITEAIIQAKVYDPDGAARVGYLDQALPTEDVLPAALATAQALSALPGHAYKANKLNIRAEAIRLMEAGFED